MIASKKSKLFRVRKKGKTRGRPSNVELTLEAILQYKSVEIQALYNGLFFVGQSVEWNEKFKEK